MRLPPTQITVFARQTVMWFGILATSFQLTACSSRTAVEESKKIPAAETKTSDWREPAAIAGAPAQYDLDSAQIASAREWYLAAGEGCRLYVREFGVGDTVVVLHGGWGAEHS